MLKSISSLFDLSSGNLEKLPITYQNAVRISARFTFCQPAFVEPGKSGLKKEVVLQTDPVFVSGSVFNFDLTTRQPFPDYTRCISN